MTTALLALALIVAPDSVEAPCSGGAVVTRADLQAAGAAHVHDALRLAGVDGVTVDGFDLRPVAAVGVPFAEAVRVLLDGAPAGRGAGIEPRGVEALPVALAEIERVVVCPGPGVAGGTFGGPWIDVRTAAPTRWAYGAATYGNEAGDPGPARYLDPSLPNVDRLGPDVEAGAALTLPSGTTPIWATVRHRDFLPTDPAILPRTLAASVPERYPKRIGWVGTATVATDRLRLRLSGRAFADLPFIPEAGREVPLRHRSLQMTASNVWPGRHGRVRAYAHVRIDSLARPGWGALDVDPRWGQMHVEAGLEAEGARDGRRRGIGAHGAVAGADGASFAVGSDETAAQGSAWVRLGRTVHSTDLDATASVAVAGSGLGGGLATAAAWQPATHLGVTLSASARRTLPTADPDLAFWAARGYAAFPGAAPEADPVDVARLRLSVTGRAGAVRLGAIAEGQVARANVLGTDRSWGRAEGTAAVARAEAAWSGRSLRLRTTAHARGALGGTDAFRSAWRRLPRLGVSLDATLRPDARLALWARLAVRSPSRWDGYSEADVPAALLLDLGLSKRAWGERLRVSLSGRNALGAEERTHPLGAALAPRLFVRLEGRL